jgi:hypothetical protein
MESRMRLLEILKLLSKDVYCSMEYDTEKEQFFIDLKTMAKSDLHLYEDGILTGRYDEKTIDLDKENDTLINTLCWEFKSALCGRDYGQAEWFKLCKQHNVII